MFKTCREKMHCMTLKRHLTRHDTVARPVKKKDKTVERHLKRNNET